MTLYFTILHASSTLNEPLPFMFALPRYWTYLSRLLSSPDLLRQPIAPQILASALEVGGRQGLQLWGRQFQKLLIVLHQMLTDKSMAENIGGPNVEGRQGRTKALLELERAAS